MKNENLHLYQVSADSTNLLGVHINDFSLPEILSFIVQTIQSGNRAIIAYVNIFTINIAYHDRRFRDFLNEADLVFCDGFGVKWATRIIGKGIQYRYTPPDWIDDLFKVCLDNSLKLYILGARPGVAEKVKEIFLSKYPGLFIVGVHHGYFNKTINNPENKMVIQDINEKKPDILIVGFGMPVQEYWISDNWSQLQVPVVIPGGALIDYMAGVVPRAPHWMTDHGLEWLGRLIIEPRRLWKRYLLGNPIFLWRVLLQRFGWLHIE
jgi:N-acetylglucosaminyldiphosphoundecaprenol N-acetyl-beta-D-mannosaminyltransferase